MSKITDNSRLSNDAQPLVSVLLPMRDAEPWVGEAIESLLRQTYTSLEVIVIDNASIDRSVDIVRAFRDARVQLIAQPVGRLVSALNAGLQHARGSLIARQDADDASRPTRIEQQVRFLALHPSIGIVGTSFEEMALDGAPIRKVAAVTDSVAIRQRLLLGMPFAGASITARREIFEQLGGYDPAFDETIGEDYDFLIRASEITELAGLAEPLYRYRTCNPKSMCGAVGYRYDGPRRFAQARAVRRGNLRFANASPEGSDHNTPT